MPLASLQRPGNGGRTGRRVGGTPTRGLTSSPQASLAALDSGLMDPFSASLTGETPRGPLDGLRLQSQERGNPQMHRFPHLGHPRPKAAQSGLFLISLSGPCGNWDLRPASRLVVLEVRGGQVLQFRASAFISLHRHRCTYVCESAGTQKACKPHMHMPSRLRLQARERALGSGQLVADFDSQGNRRAWFEKALHWLGFSQLHTFLPEAAWTGTGEATGSGISSGRPSRLMRSLVRYVEPPW